MLYFDTLRQMRARVRVYDYALQAACHAIFDAPPPSPAMLLFTAVLRRCLFALFMPRQKHGATLLLMLLLPQLYSILLPLLLRAQEAIARAKELLRLYAD